MVQIVAPEPLSTPRLAQARELADLGDIFDPACNVVRYPRPRDPALLAQAERLLGDRSWRFAEACQPKDVATALSSRLPPGVEGLINDVAHWVEVFADLSEAEWVGVRLARLEQAMCPRFHVDQLELRLVLTYCGAGTELLAERDVDRRWLGHAGAGLSDERSGLIRLGGVVERAEVMEVVVLKGELWPGNQGRGAVHRSPAASTAQPRLVLTLDPL